LSSNGINWDVSKTATRGDYGIVYVAGYGTMFYDDDGVDPDEEDGLKDMEFAACFEGAPLFSRCHYVLHEWLEVASSEQCADYYAKQVDYGAAAAAHRNIER